MQNKRRLAVLFLICTSLISFGQVPAGWEKISGTTSGYSGLPDGILNDRQNSYAWSMEIFGDYLYVGTSRNIFGSMLAQAGMFVPVPQIPLPTDMRGRIFRMHLESGEWTQVYVPPVTATGPPLMGQDIGYRMMRRFRNLLYVGSAGINEASLLTVSTGGAVQRIFRTTGANPGKIISIRAISQHMGMLFWASEDRTGPVIWYADNPSAEFQLNSKTVFHRIDVPKAWFAPAGGEVVDMISYNGSLYVFLLPYDSNMGFWCAKLMLTSSGWKWKVIVGNAAFGATYLPGMGRAKNGATVPVLFNGNVYVGTLDGAAFRMMTGTSTGDPGSVMGGPGGAQIFRFNEQDEWVRVMPNSFITDPVVLEAMNGFQNPLNKYLWRFAVSDGKLYAGTFDLGTGLQVLRLMIPNIPPVPILNPLGFDLYSTTDGVNWQQETVDGFSDQWNYGARTLLTDQRNGDLYLGTANPFYGCQVWKKSGSGSLQGGFYGQEMGSAPAHAAGCITNTWIASSNRYPKAGDRITFTVTVQADCALPVSGEVRIWGAGAGGLQVVGSGLVVNGTATIPIRFVPSATDNRVYFFATYEGAPGLNKSVSGNHEVAWFQ